jgi:hypothetical protein
MGLSAMVIVRPGKAHFITHISEDRTSSAQAKRVTY